MREKERERERMNVTGNKCSQLAHIEMLLDGKIEGRKKERRKRKKLKKQQQKTFIETEMMAAGREDIEEVEKVLIFQMFPNTFNETALNFCGRFNSHFPPSPFSFSYAL